MATNFLGEIEAESLKEAKELAEELWKSKDYPCPRDSVNISNSFDMDDAELLIQSDDLTATKQAITVEDLEGVIHSVQSLFYKGPDRDDLDIVRDIGRGEVLDYLKELIQKAKEG